MKRINHESLYYNPCKGDFPPEAQIFPGPARSRFRHLFSVSSYPFYLLEYSPEPIRTLCCPEEQIPPAVVRGLPRLKELVETHRTRAARALDIILSGPEI